MKNQPNPKKDYHRLLACSVTFKETQFHKAIKYKSRQQLIQDLLTAM